MFPYQAPARVVLSADMTHHRDAPGGTKMLPRNDSLRWWAGDESMTNLCQTRDGRCATAHTRRRSGNQHRESAALCVRSRRNFLKLGARITGAQDEDTLRRSQKPTRPTSPCPSGASDGKRWRGGECFGTTLPAERTFDRLH